MKSGESSAARSDGLLLAWPIAFGSVLTLLRLVILLAFGDRSLAEAATVFAGLPGQIAFGLLLALPLHYAQRSWARWLVHALTFAVVLLNVAAFHVEAVFGRLPGVALLYYLGEARHLASSAAANAPIVAVILEVALAGALLVLIAERLRGRSIRFAAPVTLASAVIAIVLYVFPTLLPKQLLWGSRVPLLFAIQSWTVQEANDAGGAERLDEREVLAFQSMLGIRVPFGGVDERYPLCGAAPREARQPPNGRNVIFLVLESVGVDELKLVYNGQLVMPNLNRIANESTNLTVKAAGTKSVQAFPALFAGLPPQPVRHLLWKTPLPNVEGFPRLLQQRGYRTSYFHGGDLSFEHQRPFLRMAGFGEIHEYELFQGQPFIGWGNSDDVVFRRLQNWIAARKRDRPYFATLFTLSTHDPFVLPPERPRVFGEGSGNWIRFVETLRFLDEQLGPFYQWYLEHEKPKGTLLVVTGDHAPHLAGDRYLYDKEVARFDMPLLIHGIEKRDVRGRRVAQHDIPATILGLVGVPQGRCDQGLDALVADPWPNDRTLYAVAGDLENFHVWFPEAHVELDLITRTAEVTPPGAGDAYKRRGLEVFTLARDVSLHLQQTNGFAPPPPPLRTRTPLPRVERPFFAAHRGQSRGAVPPERQSKRETIEQALRDGFRWIEIDVNLTRDQKPVLVHDNVNELTLAELRAKPGQADVLTLDEALALFGDRASLLIEIKTQGRIILPNTALTLASAAIVRTRKPSTRVIVDSYAPYIVASLLQHCRCEVALDAPPRPLDSRWVDEAAASGVDWIYVDHRQASADLVRYAHGKGLRVSVFTVNDLRELAPLQGEWPDAIITDRAGLMAEFDAARTRR